MHPSIYLLAIATFAMATTEFGIVGMIPRISAEFGIGLAEGGLIVSAYATAMVVGAVGINVVGQRLSVRAILLGCILVFSLANALSAAAPTYGLLIAGRVVSGMAQGAVYGLGTAAAAIIVRESHSTRAVSVVFVGPTIAMVLGVPLAAYVGADGGWRVVFVAIGATAFLACMLLLWVMPHRVGLHIAPAGRLVGLLGNPQLLSVYAITILSFGGSTMAFTYFPALFGDQDVNSGFYMTMFGAGAVAGNLLAGRVSDRIGFAAAAVIAIFGLIACLGLLPVTLTSPAALPAILFLWGTFAFSLPPILQTEAVRIARSSGLAAAASSLNTASFNVGIGGAALFASFLVQTIGIPAIPSVGAAMATLALLLTLAIRMRATRRPR
ncbi:MAG: MFS sugar transporter [Shinella sp.]|nr:MAG: MFS sugar transporter [Shinella sp.]